MRTRSRAAALTTLSLILFITAPLSALDLREIDEHLEYLDRHLASLYSPPPPIDTERFMYSLIGVIGTLEAALADRPNDPQILRRLGDAYRMAAGTDIDKLLRSLDFQNQKELRVPGWHEHLKLAKDYLEKARSLAPRDPDVYVALGKTCGTSREELKKAIAYFERAVSLAGPSASPSTMKWLSYFYLEIGQPGKALDTIETFLKTNPADHSALQIYMRAGMPSLDRNSERFPREHSLIFLPADYDPNKRYPVLVDVYGLVLHFGFPFPGRPVSLKSFDAQAAKKIQFDPELQSQRSLIVLVPKNFDRGQDFRTWEGFSSLIETCEQRVLSDLEKIEQWYGVDTSKVGLCGFSIGADLSWALSNRHPDVFCGAIVNGSRCGYIDKTKFEELAKRDARFYLTIAKDDSEARVDGMENAKRLLDAAGVENMYIKTASGGHRPEVLDLETAVDYLLFE
jgi:tetratricopeptide (TPR) repeat protein